MRSMKTLQFALLIALTFVSLPAVAKSLKDLNAIDASRVTGVPLEDVRVLRSFGPSVLEAAIKMSEQVERAIAGGSIKADQDFLRQIRPIYFSSPKQSLLEAMASSKGKSKVANRFVLFIEALRVLRSGKARKAADGRVYIGAKPDPL